MLCPAWSNGKGGRQQSCKKVERIELPKGPFLFPVTSQAVQKGLGNQKCFEKGALCQTEHLVQTGSLCPGLFQLRVWCAGVCAEAAIVQGRENLLYFSLSMYSMPVSIETWSFASTRFLVPCSPWRLQHLQRQFYRAVLLASSGLFDVLLTHFKFPRSAKLLLGNALGMLLIVPWCCLLRESLWRKLKKRNNLGSTFCQKEH